MMDVSKKKTWKRALEFALLYIGIPLAMYFARRHIHRSFLIVLWIIMAGCLIPLLRDPTFIRNRLGWGDIRTSDVKRMLIRLLIGVPVLTAGVYFFLPHLFLGLPRHRPVLWIMVMILYPLLSVYPQEIIYRTFYYQRYAPRLTDARVALLVNGLVFGWGHLFFANGIAPSLSVAGGLLFADTYRRSRSTLLTVIEHGLWGDVIFTIGLGWYFYGGSITAAQ